MPPLPSEVKPRPPADFAAMLATAKPLLLVGGQAVNLWALYYQERTAGLTPFVSRDADVLGDRETLKALGKLAGAKPQFFPLRPPSNEVGVVITKDANGQPLLIEVLRFVHGVTNEELSEPIYTMAIGEGGVHVQVPGPIVLLKAKIANLADLPQVGRQDSRHVAILARLLPAYLEDLQKAASEGRLEERKFIGFLERLLVIVTSKNGQKTFERLKIEPHALFAGLKAGKLVKLQAFMQKRLPRAISRQV
jgi:hypothetical protein